MRIISKVVIVLLASFVLDSLTLANAQEYIAADPTAAVSSPPQASANLNVVVPKQPSQENPPAQDNAKDNKNSHAYTDAEKQAWFHSCLGAVNDKKAVAFAEEFCNCGWTHISSGQLAAELLSNTSPEALAQRNMIMRVISQQCIVELMAKHNLS